SAVSRWTRFIRTKPQSYELDDLVGRRHAWCSRRLADHARFCGQTETTVAASNLVRGRSDDPVFRFVCLTFNSAARQLVLIYGALPLAYIITGHLGLVLAVSPGYATAVFLPAGIGVGAAFMLGVASVPGTFLGSFVLNIWAGYSVHTLS